MLCCFFWSKSNQNDVSHSGECLFRGPTLSMPLEEGLNPGPKRRDKQNMVISIVFRTRKPTQYCIDVPVVLPLFYDNFIEVLYDRILKSFE